MVKSHHHHDALRLMCNFVNMYSNSACLHACACVRDGRVDADGRACPPRGKLNGHVSFRTNWRGCLFVDLFLLMRARRLIVPKTLRDEEFCRRPLKRSTYHHHHHHHHLLGLFWNTLYESVHQ